MAARKAEGILKRKSLGLSWMFLMIPTLLTLRGEITKKDMDESNTDSGESDNSASEIEHEDILPLESGDSDNV